MAKAVNALQTKQVTRIILTRPAVEAGERLGFLPGTLSEKIDPYLRPLYDALHDMMDPELDPEADERRASSRSRRWRTCAVGRLNDAFIILDEAQNTTAEQMKMFLTRLGLRLEDRCHRRHHAGGPARWRRVGSARGDANPRRHRRHPLRRAHQRRRGAAPTGVRHRRRLCQVRGARPDEPGATTCLRQSAPAVADIRPMSIEVSNESGIDVSEARTDQRRPVRHRARWTCNPAAELSMVLLDTRRWPTCTCGGWTCPVPPT